jgi:predicted aspartyl protease
LLPSDILERLDVEKLDRVTFQLADERTMEYDVGQVDVRLDGRDRTVLVVFGPEGAMPLLGATTQELLNLAADPVRRRLISVPGLL